MKIILSFMLVLTSAIICQAQTLPEALNNKDTVQALKLIKDGGDVNAVDNYGSTNLMTVCRWGDAAMVSFLLNHGAKVDEPRSPKGRTPLMVACAYYSGVSICKLLIDKKADVNATDQTGVTPLMLAAQSAKLDVVQLLLDRGADANKKDTKGQTALNYAQQATELEYIAKSVKDCKIDKDATVALLKSKMK